MGKYGEPWVRDSQQKKFAWSGGKEPHGLLHQFEDENECNRAIACVNAMEGLEPEGLNDVIRWSRNARTVLLGMGAAHEADCLYAALKRLGAIE